MQYLRLSIATLLVGLLVSGCDQSPSPSAQRKPHSQRVAIEIIKPVSTTIERRFNALIIAPNTINISNQIAGTIITMPFRAGSAVNKGDILVELDSSLTKAEHLKSLASLEKANQDLQRIKKLIPQQLASAEQLSAAITERKLAQADVTLKSIQLNRSTIKAAFTGIISDRLFEPGETVAINTKLLTLVDKQNLIVKSSIPESFISHIKLNKEVKIKIPALSLVLSGNINAIYPTVDSKTQQVTIETTFDNINSQFYPGQFAELIIQSRTREKILIAVNAVQYDSKGAWVYTVDKQQTAQQTYITTGQNFNTKIEILNGLNNGDKVITKGFIGLRPGKKIKPDTLPVSKHK